MQNTSPLDSGSFEDHVLRRRFRWAAGWMLLNAGAHLAVHWVLYADTSRIGPESRALMEHMQSYLLLPAWGVSLWTVLGMFSMLYALLLGTFGAGQWVLARESETHSLHRHAWRNFVLCGVVAVVLVLAYPVPQVLLTFMVASALYARAALSPYRMPAPDELG